MRAKLLGHAEHSVGLLRQARHGGAQVTHLPSKLMAALMHAVHVVGELQVRQFVGHDWHSPVAGFKTLFDLHMTHLPLMSLALGSTHPTQNPGVEH